MCSRSLLDLASDVYPLAERMMVQCAETGLPVLVTCTLRSSDEQAALFAQCRQPLLVVNKLRAIAKLPPITEADNARIVTKAKPGQSLHETGRAIDIYPLDGGKIVYDAKSSLWLVLGAIGESIGLEWAGRWERFREMAHFQKSLSFEV
jgi:peptidoglycan L-alanyl-D-glutamate endopeptidase CwlK